MPAPPAGAQLSEDGAYWWDDANQAWQLVDDSAGYSGGASGSSGSSGDDGAGQLSEDGHYRWDGQQWQPVDTGDPGGAGVGVGGVATAAGGGAGSGDTVEVPADLIEELNNFTSQYPELTALYEAGDGDTYLRTVVGMEPPTENDDLPVS